MRRVNGPSVYFRGAFNKYGRYQWNIKYYRFESEFEIESAILWAFGEYSYKDRGFDGLNELLGRAVKSGTDGRSGGWLVIDTELTDAELELIDAHVESCLKGLPDFLKEEREYRKEFETA